MSHLRAFIIPASILATLLLVTGGSASRASAADSATGKLVIVKALYGDLSDDTAIDVTQKVAAMVKDNNLSVDAGKATLGPAPGAGAKQLKVGYLIDGVYRSKTVNDGETLDISTRLFIRKAIYGALPNGPTADVTEQVSDAIRRNRLSLSASNETFGDPANGVVKHLRVDYTFDGVDGSKTVREGETITLPEKEK